MFSLYGYLKKKKTNNPTFLREFSTKCSYTDAAIIWAYINSVPVGGEELEVTFRLTQKNGIVTVTTESEEKQLPWV